MMKQIILLILFPTLAYAQKIDQTVSFRDIQKDSYFRINYENDLFVGTDDNYTQGINLEFVLPALSKNPLNNLLIIPKDWTIKYGMALEHIVYTPKHFELPEIQIGDRPFAAALMLKSFVVATDSIHKSRLTSSFNLGLLGPSAFGKEMQVDIHKVTGNAQPLGWDNQIKNDVVINYRLSYEQQLLQFRNIFRLQGVSSIQLGTLFTNASIGFNTTLGIVNSLYTSSKKGFALYLYAQPSMSVIGYDATIQGGLFNRNSPYTISNANIERFTAKLEYGLVLQTRSLYFEYSRTLISREIKTIGSAGWGGLKMGFAF